MKIFKKKEQKFYTIEADNISGDAVFHMIGKLLSTKHAKHTCDYERNDIIAFVSTKTSQEILKQLEETFGDSYNIESKGVIISMTPKKVKAL